MVESACLAPCSYLSVTSLPFSEPFKAGSWGFAKVATQAAPCGLKVTTPRLVRHSPVQLVAIDAGARADAPARGGPWLPLGVRFATGQRGDAGPRGDHRDDGQHDRGRLDGRRYGQAAHDRRRQRERPRP